MINARKKYSTERKVSIALRIILVALVAFAVYTVITTAQAGKDWDVSYPMVNSRVEWTGAGYNGCWGR